MHPNVFFITHFLYGLWIKCKQSGRLWFRPYTLLHLVLCAAHALQHTSGCEPRLFKHLLFVERAPRSAIIGCVFSCFLCLRASLLHWDNGSGNEIRFSSDLWISNDFLSGFCSVFLRGRSVWATRGGVQIFICVKRRCLCCMTNEFIWISRDFIASVWWY